MASIDLIVLVALIVLMALVGLVALVALLALRAYSSAFMLKHLNFTVPVYTIFVLSVFVFVS